MKKIALVSLLAACLLYDVLRVEAADDASALAARLAEIEHLQGRFEQRQYDPQGELTAESSGHFRLLRPDYFAWEISTPDSQLIIADREFLWHYDRDLETVTRRPVDAGAHSSPLQILGGDAELLGRDYAVSQQGENTYRLVPRSSEAGFRELTVTLGRPGIERMVILDNLQQRVEIRLLELDARTPLSPEDFRFTPPPGADLFYHEQ